MGSYHMTEDRDKWWDFVKRVMKHQAPCSGGGGGNSFVTWTNISVKMFLILWSYIINNEMYRCVLRYASLGLLTVVTIKNTLC
jgi:hypothetical protein